MKKIEAMIKPFKLEEVKDALHEIGVEAMTVIETKGFNRQGSHTETFRGSQYVVDFLPEVKFEIVVPDRQVDDAVTAILKSAKTGKNDAGQVFVYPMEEAIRIRTEQRGEAAIC
jgi:nitrogen regulatory protein P-II 1